MSQSNISIILPTYNERKNIEELVPLLFSYIPNAKIYVVDDNSPDGTADVVIALQSRFTQLKLIRRANKEGLGRAYVCAFKEVLKEAGVDVVIMMDADSSHHPSYLPAMLSRVRGGNVVIGSRYVRGGKTTGWELWRRVLSRCGNWYCRLITGMPIRDCTGGFNVMSASALRGINLDTLDTSGFAFIMDLKYALYSAGATFVEVPIEFANRRMGESKISNHVIREGIIAPWKMRFKRGILHESGVRYLLGGFFVFAVSIGLLYFFVDILGIWYLWATTATFCIALALSFTVQKYWTFQDHSLDRLSGKIGIYAILQLCNLAANDIFMYLSVGRLGISHLIAQVGSNAVIAMWSFFAYRKIFTTSLQREDGNDFQDTTLFSCIACGNKEHSFFVEKNGYKIYRCKTCRMCSIHPIPSLSELGAVYSEDYFSGATSGLGYVDYDADKEAMTGVFERYLKMFSSVLGGMGRLLDVGAATGFFMRIANSFGWKTEGVEISSYAVGQGKERGLSIHRGTIHEADFLPDTFDVITMWDVIEHVPNPIHDIQKAHSLLRSGGLLAINTQDAGSLFAKVMGRRWHQLVTPEHIYHFNRKSLQMLLRDNNFSVLEVSCVGKRFTLEYIAHMLYSWQGLSIWARVLSYLRAHPAIAQLALPLNLRDNMFVLAQKI